jgi:hypothetical protein
VKVEVWASRSDRYMEPLLLWSGEMDCIPREGEGIVIFDGWSAEIVKRVYYNLPGMVVELQVHDDTGEYAEYMRSRKDGEG